MPKQNKDDSSRRRISELATRYELHPDMKDVYVEGFLDKAVIGRFLHRYGRTAWRVYPVSSVNVPSDIVEHYGLDVGERGEVLALGSRLSELLPLGQDEQVVCIADRDMEAFGVGVAIECRLCLLTDFTSMELYGFAEGALDALIHGFLGYLETSGAQVIQVLAEPLQELFILRVAFHGAGWGIRFVTGFERCLAVERDGVSVDSPELVARTLNQVSRDRQPDRLAVEREIESVRLKRPAEPRLGIRGHDFVAVLRIFLAGRGVPTKLLEDQVMGQGLVLAMDSVDLASFPLFEELLRRTAA